MAPVLYKMAPSPPSRAVQMVAELVGAPVICKDLNLLTRENHSPEYLKKNPLHTIPFFEDGNFMLNDSHAIAAYLVGAYGKDDTLYPKELKKRAIVDSRLHFDGGVFFPRFRAAVINIIFRTGEATPEQLKDLIECYDILEAYLTKTPWVAGGQMTIADVCIASLLASSEILIPLDGTKYPKLKAWQDKMSELPCYQTINVPGVQEHAKLIEAKKAK